MSFPTGHVTLLHTFHSRSIQYINQQTNTRLKYATQNVCHQRKHMMNGNVKSNVLVAPNRVVSTYTINTKHAQILMGNDYTAFESHVNLNT